MFDGIKDGIVNAFKTVVNAIIRGINKVIAVPFNAINSVLEKIHGISILGVSPFSWVHTFNVPQIPELEEGGVLEKGQVGLLEGKGAEAVVPLEKNTGWIQRVARQIQSYTIEANNSIKNILPVDDIREMYADETREISRMGDLLERMLDFLMQYFPEFAALMEKDVVLDDGTLVAKLTPKIDRQLAVIYKRKDRG